VISSRSIIKIPKLSERERAAAEGGGNKNVSKEKEREREKISSGCMQQRWK
jgi:hypothetical protein